MRLESANVPAGGIELASGDKYQKPLKSFRGRELLSIFVASLSQWSKHKAPRLGASLAFYTLLSIAPLLLVLASVVGMILGQQRAQADIISQVHVMVGEQGAIAAQTLLEGSRNAAHGILATAFGLLTLLFGASGVMIELHDAMNTIWEVPTPDLRGLKKLSGFVRERLFSFALVLAVGFVLIVSLAISAAIAALGAWWTTILPAPEAVLHVLNFLVSLAIIAGLFSAIYKVLPDIAIEWHDVVLGGIVTALLFTLGKLALGIYLGKATFASTYGAAASIVVLIVWVYYSGQIFFLGAEFTKIFAYQYGSHVGRSPWTVRGDNGAVAAADRNPKILSPAQVRTSAEPNR